MTPCDSSLIKGYEFDENSWVLTVVFRSNNSARAYNDCSPELFGEFESSESKGKFYNSRIKGVLESLDLGKIGDEEIHPARCDGDHGEPRCSDPQCWHSEPSPETLKEIDRSVKAAEESLGITDEDIQAVDPLYKDPRAAQPKEPEGTWHGVPLLGVKTEESIVETLAKTENVAMSVPKSSRTELQSLLDESHGLVVAVKPITSIAEYTAVSERLQKKVTVRDRLFNILDPVRKALWDALTVTRTQHGLILDPIDASIKADKQALVAWSTEQQRIAEEKQRAAQRAAEEEAAKEQARRTEALRLQVAQEQAEAGDMEQAEASLFDQTIQAAPVQVYAPRVEVAVPVIEGQSTRKNWSAEVVDFEALVLDVAEGIKSLKATNSLAGHAPITVLEVCQPKLNQLAKASEATLRIPGVVARNNPVLAQRKGRG